MRSKHSVFRSALVGTASCLAIAAFTPANAQERNQTISIASQPLGDAINALSRQTGVVIISPSELVEGRTSPQLTGSLSTEAALERLLAGTGLTAARATSGTFAIQRSPSQDQPSQQAQAWAAASSVDETATEIEEVVVIGYRESLNRALDIKRLSDGVVDSLVASDIAELPSENLAEALARVSGVTIDRTSGEGTRVSIRGLSTEFTNTLVNGMQATTASDSRAFDFTILAADLFSNVRVEKTPDAASIEGGLSGTVSLGTPRPSQFNDRTIAFSGRAGYNSIVEEFEPRLSALYADQLNDRLSFVLSASYQDRERRQDSSDTTEWTDQDLRLASGSVLDDVFIVWIPRGLADIRSYERLGLTGAIEYRFTDDWVANLSAIYSTEDSTYERYTYEWYVKDAARLLQGRVTRAVIGGESGRTVVQADVDDGFIRTDIQDQALDTEFQLYSFDLDGRFAGFDIAANLGYSKGEREWGVRNRFRYQIIADYSYDIRRNPRIPDITTSLTDPLSPTGWRLATAEVEYQRQLSDELAAAISASRSLDLGPISDISFGFRVSDRNTEREFSRAIRASSVTSAQAASVLAPTSFDNFLTGLDGVPAAYPRQWLAVDLDASRALFGTASSVPLGRASSRFAADAANNYTINENTTASYVRFGVDQPLGSMNLDGNFGVRLVETTVTTDGLSNEGARGVLPYSNSRSYSIALPSLNLRLETSESLLFRLAASETISRPSLTDLSPRRNVDVARGLISQGNPGLNPFSSVNFDLGVEYYFGDESLLSAAYFTKTIEGRIIQDSSVQVIDGSSFIVSQPINSPESETISGIELQFQAPLRFLPGRLSNLGTVLNYTYVQGEDSDFGTPGYRHGPQGLSEQSYSAILYYQEGPLSLRTSWTFRGNYYQRPAIGLPVYDDDYGQLDAFASYDIGNNMALTVEAVNVTNSKAYEYANFTDMMERYGSVGQTLYVGLKATF